MWCGARKGRSPDEPAAARAGRRPTVSRVTSIASAAVSGGRIARQPAGQHRLAGAGRALHAEVVAAGGRHLERARISASGRARRTRSSWRHGSAPRPHRRRRGRLGVAARARRPPRAASRPRATSTPATSAASARLATRDSSSPGEPVRGAGPSATASTPRIERSSPPSARARRRPRSLRSARPRAGRRRRASRRRAPGRTPAPLLRRYAGARLTVIRLPGNSKPEFVSAARTRSRASRTALSARPTIVNVGRPCADVDLDPHAPRLDPVDREGDDAGDHECRDSAVRRRVRRTSATES